MIVLFVIVVCGCVCVLCLVLMGDVMWCVGLRVGCCVCGLLILVFVGLVSECVVSVCWFWFVCVVFVNGLLL